MRVKIIGSSEAEAIGWGAVKAFLVLIMVWLVMPSISQSVSGRGGTTSGTVLAGRIRATRITPVTLEFNARAVSVAVKAGERVEAGQLLAVLDSPEIDERLERAQRRLEIAEQRLHVPAGSVNRRLWQEQHLNAQQRSQEAKARLAAFSIAAAESSHSRAEKELVSMTRMVQQHLATAQDLESARRQLDLEQANLNNARSSLIRLKQEVSAADSQLRMVLIQKDTTDPSADSAARLDFEDALHAVETAERQKSALRVVAPQAGTVLTVSVEAGASIGGWTPLFQIADLTRLQVEVPVTARVARMIHPGSRVKIALPGDPPQELDAQVGDLQLVPEQLENSHVVRIPISNSSASSILVGMECTVEFQHGGPA